MRAMVTCLVTCVVCLAACVQATGAPSVSSVSGEMSHGSALAISGSGFGNNGDEVPIKFDDFESGTVGTSPSGMNSCSTPASVCTSTN